MAGAEERQRLQAEMSRNSGSDHPTVRVQRLHELARAVLFDVIPNATTRAFAAGQWREAPIGRVLIRLLYLRVQSILGPITVDVFEQRAADLVHPGSGITWLDAFLTVCRQIGNR